MSHRTCLLGKYCEEGAFPDDTCAVHDLLGKSCGEQSLTKVKIASGKKVSPSQ